MRVIESVQQCQEVFPHVVLTVGSFDGLHLGHQRIVQQVVARARATEEATAAVLTLTPHPRRLFAPDRAPNLLTTDTKKLELLEAAGIDVTFFLRFTPEVAALEPVRFIEQIVLGRCHARELVVGHDFCFGSDARGDHRLLEEASARYGLRVLQVPPVLVDGERVSSTVVRELLLEGDLDGVERFLGRRYSLVGEVVRGRGIGAGLGYPTANLRPHHSAVPAQGVYAAEVVLSLCRRPAAVNIGIAPTVRQQDIVIEAHILDFAADIVGKPMEIVFHKRLRPEQKFSSHEALTAQIARDVEAVRAHFSRCRPAKDS